jgi:ActR/RegA family two-component response regulator
LFRIANIATIEVIPMENQPIRVLLIDDEERFVLNLAKLMRGRGFEVLTAFDGPSGIAAAEQGVDVVVLDVKMPGMGGIEALQRIKEASPETEVLMLTGHADVETGIEAMRAGALDYLMKPCDIDDLVAKIREAHEIGGIKRRPVLWPRRLVKEITWPSFVRLEAEDPLSRALDVFTRQAGISAREELYILDAEDRLQGVITRRDLVAAAQPDPVRPFPLLGGVDGAPAVASRPAACRRHAHRPPGRRRPGGRPGRHRPPHAGGQSALPARDGKRPGHRHRPAERCADAPGALKEQRAESRG